MLTFVDRHYPVPFYCIIFKQSRLIWIVAIGLDVHTIEAQSEVGLDLCYGGRVERDGWFDCA